MLLMQWLDTMLVDRIEGFLTSPTDSSGGIPPVIS